MASEYRQKIEDTLEEKFQFFKTENEKKRDILIVSLKSN